MGDGEREFLWRTMLPQLMAEILARQGGSKPIVPVDEEYRRAMRGLDDRLRLLNIGNIESQGLPRSLRNVVGGVVVEVLSYFRLTLLCTKYGEFLRRARGLGIRELDSRYLYQIEGAGRATTHHTTNSNYTLLAHVCTTFHLGLDRHYHLRHVV